MNLEYQIKKPEGTLEGFVDFFWMLANPSSEEQEVVVLPDGRVDVFFSVSAAEPYGALLMGLSDEPQRSVIVAGSRTFAVSFNLLAVEYILDTPISLSSMQQLRDGFWGVTEKDLDDFDGFCTKVSAVLSRLLKPDVDDRKRQLFELIYSTNGTVAVKELSDKVFWSSRQINRYFNQWFGLSLKAYCNILRFRASFPHIKDGKLYPEQNYTDQAHFIKEVKKYAGVSPKELSRNKDERFIHITTLPRKR
ncbi:MAG: helix-turn-helix transcriptional regulator [Bacteroidetes bacterium]|nr:helix-turn-helix transcriptional regulator [Bacteroidota bacterium]